MNDKTRLIAMTSLAIVASAAAAAQTIRLEESKAKHRNAAVAHDFFSRAFHRAVMRMNLQQLEETFAETTDDLKFLQITRHM